MGGLSESSSRGINSLLASGSPKPILRGRIQPRGYARFGKYCDAHRKQQVEEPGTFSQTAQRNTSLLATAMQSNTSVISASVRKEARERLRRIVAKIKAVATLKKLIRARKKRLNPDIYVVAI